MRIEADLLTIYKIIKKSKKGGKTNFYTKMEWYFKILWKYNLYTTNV